MHTVVVHKDYFITLLFSGVKPVDKRDGGGAHNWGTMRDDLE